MLQSGRVAFGAMETVVFGKPAAETVAEEARRRDAERVFLMVSGTLNRTTDEITKMRRALGNRFAGLFDHMPPHTPRHAVIEAAEMAREAGADLIVTVGGGSITDGAKAVQLCLANNVRNAEAINGLRPVKKGQTGGRRHAIFGELFDHRQHPADQCGVERRSRAGPPVFPHSSSATIQSTPGASRSTMNRCWPCWSRVRQAVALRRPAVARWRCRPACG